MFSKKITRFSKLLNSGIWDVIVGQLKITRSGQVNTHLIYPDDMVLREWVPSTYQQIGEWFASSQFSGFLTSLKLGPTLIQQKLGQEPTGPVARISKSRGCHRLSPSSFPVPMRSAGLPRWIHPWTCRVWANSSGNSMKRCGIQCGKTGAGGLIFGYFQEMAIHVEYDDRPVDFRDHGEARVWTNPFGRWDSSEDCECRFSMNFWDSSQDPFYWPLHLLLSVGTDPRSGSESYAPQTVECGYFE